MQTSRKNEGGGVVRRRRPDACEGWRQESRSARTPDDLVVRLAVAKFASVRLRGFRNRAPD